MIRTYLEAASDQPWLRDWRSQLAEMQYFSRLNPRQCADHCYLQFARTSINLRDC